MFSSIFEFVCCLFISSYEAVVLGWECLGVKSYDLQIIISITRGPLKDYLNFVIETYYLGSFLQVAMICLFSCFSPEEMGTWHFEN